MRDSELVTFVGVQNLISCILKKMTPGDWGSKKEMEHIKSPKTLQIKYLMKGMDEFSARQAKRMHTDHILTRQTTVIYIKKYEKHLVYIFVRN